MFDNLTNAQLLVLGDMLDYWLDKDRHGELESGYSYTSEEQDALYEMYEAFRKVTRQF